MCEYALTRAGASLLVGGITNLVVCRCVCVCRCMCVCVCARTRPCEGERERNKEVARKRND